MNRTGSPLVAITNWSRSSSIAWPTATSARCRNRSRFTAPDTAARRVVIAPHAKQAEQEADGVKTATPATRQQQQSGGVRMHPRQGEEDDHAVSAQQGRSDQDRHDGTDAQAV